VLPPGTCTAIPCAAVGDVLGGGLISKSYLSESTNPVAGTCTAPDFLGCPVRGQWSNPVTPALVKADIVTALVVTPQAACPAAGCPTVIFAHAIGQSKTNAFAIAPQFAQRGFATVAIDAVAHDSRAIRISNNAAIGCGGPRPSPLAAPQCFAPFLSPNLGAARDNIRQTVLDYHGLIAALKACNATACGGFKPDLTKLYYVGQSLGGILGGMTVATSSDLKGAVLNVAGVGWADILENTQTNQLRCPLVDGLIDAGILLGEKSNLAVTPATGLCTMEAKAWQDQPGYRQFSVIGRWVLDPADPANFTAKLRTRKVLLQEVDGDTVVPNLATANEGRLLDLMRGSADPIVLPPPAPTPSAPITTNPMSSKWVRYSMSSGNVFGHSSLLQPPPASGLAGSLGVLRMQTDAISYLLLNP
jgi:dienelactone hydrolase